MTQEQALDILKLGKNVYLTGSAGSGKTHTLNRYIEYLKKHDVAVGITASTGIAATHMGGVTIHSYLGIGIKDSLDEHDLESLESKQYLYKRLEKVKVLIIDEISMLHHFRLDLVEQVLRHFKRNDKPFGGVQIVLCGDFFQLPPVRAGGQDESHFAYKSRSFKEAGFAVCYLSEQHRQKDDVLLSILEGIRSGGADESIARHLNKRAGKSDEIIGQPTRLYTHNIDVDSINQKELGQILGERETFEMSSSGNPKIVEILKKSCLAPEKLELKKGARVMFVKNNYDIGYVNGTLGTVVSLDGSGPLVETVDGERILVEKTSWTVEENGKVLAEIKQFPLRLAWAITVHKSQGMSLDLVEVDLTKSFERGMGYVALSRARTWEGLFVKGFNEMALLVNEEVLSIDGHLKERSENIAKWISEISDEDKSRAQKGFLASVAKTGKGDSGKVKKRSTYDETKDLLLEKRSLSDIAKARSITKETVVSHIEKLLEEDSAPDIYYLKNEVSGSKFKKIIEAFEECLEENPDRRLSPVKNILGPNISYNDIRLARLFLDK